MLRVQIQQYIAQRVLALLVTFVGLVTVTPALADTALAPIGGEGGGAFSQRCSANKVLFGLELSTGDDVDSVRPVCATALAKDHVTNDLTEGPFHGGRPGALRLTCPPTRPAIIGLYVAYEGEKTFIVNNIHLFCGQVTDIDQPLAATPDNAYDGPNIRPRTSFPSRFIVLGKDSQRCPPGQIAVGINGRSGVWLDAVGLICGGSPVTAARPPTTVNLEPAVCRSLDQARAGHPPASAVTIATLETLCNKALPPPASCRALVEVINANGPAATINALQAQCSRARKARGL